ncbi:hypothetical protein ANN_26848 [Periplaneta americana]|uniref:Reverse transcriptase n=1 Tax=Periplaneta americana TaxID=6978 RepID=A0ABQ8RZ86_PERAM|nr:hypothetical protein ANN_26848 [Periplaneta americana]
MLRHRPVLFEENGNTVTMISERYVEILRTFLQPELRRRLQGIARQIVWFQQDGATGHTAENSMPVVRRMFPGHITSRRGYIPWPPCSPDLTVCKYFLWDYLKSKVQISNDCESKERCPCLTSVVNKCTHLSKKLARRRLEARDELPAWLAVPRRKNRFALNVNVKKFKQARENSGSNYDVDPLMRAYIDGGRLEMRLLKLANALRLNFPLTSNALVRARNQLKEKEADDCCALQSQGQGVPNFRNDPVVNSWLYDPSVFHPKRFIDALKLRNNTYGVNVTLARADKSRNVACRRCHEKPETLEHVLGECVAGKGMCINRHNAIVKRIAEESTKRGYTVAREPQHLVDERRLKPDLVLTNEDGVLVVDVTVRYDNGSSLYDAHKEKVSKYQALADNLAGGQARVAKVLPIVVGSRGAIPLEIRDCLTTLGVVGRLRLEKYLSPLALGSSLDYT